MNKIDRAKLKTLIQSTNVADLTYEELKDFFLEDSAVQNHLPDNHSEIDPRNGEQIIYVSKRGSRPHDNRPDESGLTPAKTSCPICQGNTTCIVDWADLSDGFTFINKNLFPVVYPDQQSTEVLNGSEMPSSDGMHFLQWTSNVHDQDFHNLPPEDCAIVLSRLAALEKTLMQNPTGNDAHVSITKNFGHLVGGSLVHGHQQIVYNHFIPNRIKENLRFAEVNGEAFSSFLIRENPAELMVKDYGTAVLLVPYFMRRPYCMMLLLKNSTRKHLYDLTSSELKDTAQGWHDAIALMRILMPQIGRELAYNVITNNGPGAGLYFEFLPYTQEIGGFELLGLYACQTDPIQAAAHLKNILENIC